MDLSHALSTAAAADVDVPRAAAGRAASAVPATAAAATYDDGPDDAGAEPDAGRRPAPAECGRLSVVIESDQIQTMPDQQIRSPSEFHRARRDGREGHCRGGGHPFFRAEIHRFRIIGNPHSFVEGVGDPCQVIVCLAGLRLRLLSLTRDVVNGSRAMYYSSNMKYV